MTQAWVVTDGRVGMENQARALAEALGYEACLKRIRLRRPWLWVAPFIRWGKQWSFTAVGETLGPPFPEAVVACGRRSILPALWIREAAQGATRVLYLHDPHIPPGLFDAVVCPQHDALEGSNVYPMFGAPHAVNPTTLAAAHEAVDFSYLPEPRVGVLIGGASRAYGFGPQDVQRLVDALVELQRAQKASLLLTPSRRTPPGVLSLLQQRLDPQRTFFWRGQGKNPYFSILAWSQALILTCDSVNMITEACATEAPLYLFQLSGEGSKKIARFHRDVVETRKLAQWWPGEPLTFHPRPAFFAMEEVLASLRKRGFGA